MSNVPRIPAYRHHKPSGRAVVTIGSRDVYLGKYNSAASRQEYHRVIAEWTSQCGATAKASHDLTVSELLAAFIKSTRRTHSSLEQFKFALVARPLNCTVARWLPTSGRCG